MLNKRLLTVASLIKKDATVLDVGCDHAYLPIYLKKNNLVKDAFGSDVSKNALNIAQKNVQKFNVDVKLFLANGLEGINEFFDTLVISGMGSSTMISILKDKSLPQNLVLSSNNDLPSLRLFVNSLGYKIEKEVVIFEKGKFYDIIAFIKGKEKLTKKEILYGKSNDKKYLKYLYEKEKSIFKKTNLKNKLKTLPKIIRLFFLSR